eukprot:UN04954
MVFEEAGSLPNIMARKKTEPTTIPNDTEIDDQNDNQSESVDSEAGLYSIVSEDNDTPKGPTTDRNGDNEGNVQNNNDNNNVPKRHVIQSGSLQPIVRPTPKNIQTPPIP